MTEPNWKSLGQKLSLSTWRLNRQKHILTEALTHRSATRESLPQDHNERLEFLGDAVLELVVTERLFLDFPDQAEGVLTAYRSALVSRENLALVGHKHDFGEFLILSSSEERSGGRQKDYLLANLIEALIGALFVGYGQKEATKFILQFIWPELQDIIDSQRFIDPKSELQEFTQGALGITPVYGMVGEEGKDHDKRFYFEVKIKEFVVGEGTGGSKKEAQVAAAKNALENKPNWENEISSVEKAG